jgi:RNA polymerase sigma-70 factor, ECF subfamily
MSRMMAAMSGRARSERDVPVRHVDHRDPRPERTGGTPIEPDLSVAVWQAQKGDEDAFRLIYRTVQPGLLRYLRGLVGDDAEDVASEAWSQIARDLGTFRGDGDGFRAWAATIARHRALDHLRQQRRRPVVTSSIDDLTDLAAGEDTAVIALDAVATDSAIALIATLPRDQAEAVLLRVVMGLDAATVGRVLGKRAGAVRTATHRGLRRLADRLADMNDPRSGDTDGRPPPR